MNKHLWIQHAALAAAAIFAFGGPIACAQAVSNLDQQAWEAINNKLIAKIQGVDPDLLKSYEIQLPSTPLYLMWDQGDDGAWEFLNVADQIPHWGPTWAPSSVRFSDEYRVFANSVAIRSRTDVDARDLDAKATAYETLSERTRAEYNKLLAERKAYKNAQRAAGDAIMPFTDWVQNQSVHGPRWKSLEAQRDSAYTAWSNLLSPEEQSLGVLKKKMTGYSPDPDTNTVKGEVRYPYNYAAASVRQIKVDGDQAFANHTPVFTFESKSDTEHKAEERTTWGANASFSGGFFGLNVGAGASGSHYTLDIANQASSFTYAAYGFGFVGIEPRGWYSGTLVSAYKDKTRAFLPTSSVSFETLWGPTGSLNLEVVGVIVAYRPQITAHMTTAMVKQVKDTLTAGGSVSWGPLSFGGRYTKTSETYDAHAEEGTITISSTSPFPYVVAVLSKRLNYVEQK